MKSATISLIMLSVTLSALAQVSFKYGMSTVGTRAAEAGASPIATLLDSLIRPGVIVGLALYGIGTLLWLQVLSRTDLSQAYPFVGVGFVLTALFGALLFGETITVMRAFGTILVIIGIYVIARS